MTNNNFPSMINGFLLSDEQMKEFNVFMEQYGNKPDRYIYREIDRVRNEVSPEILAQHVNNLEQLEKMQGFVADANKERIATVKRILTSPKSSFRRSRQESLPSTQFVSGTSLLLWFLILVAIWPRPYFYY